ncbi:MAG TPA: methionine--tRNA ligase [Vicinamibacterales bacterium]|nr:methionine--tRNA ligase [Vicinamibacterales bacterium]
MRFYLTTAIDYVNSRPHLGTAYEKVTADVIARDRRLRGLPTRFLMGNDEHSQNVYRRARELGLDPLAYCDRMEAEFREVWARLDVSFDDFIRTTEPRHRAGVTRLVERIAEAGDIYEGLYEGWYCVSCEAFKQEKDLVDGKCPVHLIEPEWIRERNYFFRLSRYRDRLLAHFEACPQFLEPEIRRNEILRLLEAGLEDLSISRAGQAWGIPLPMDPSSVVYVWFDALINYISAVGYGTDDALFAEWWPADLHVVGKDITRFHTVVWPAMLMSAGLPLPKQVFGHGWVHFKGQRMSKTLGTVVDPLDAAARLGPDPLRLYLVKEIAYGADGDFSWDRFEERYNVDLANNLGNLVNRLAVMVQRYRHGRLQPPSGVAGRLAAAAEAAVSRYRAALDRYALHEGAAAAFSLVDATNEFIAATEPWSLARDSSAADRLNAVLYEAAEAVRIAALLLLPVMPRSAAEILRRMGERTPPGELRLDRHAVWRTADERVVILADPLWPRIEEPNERKEPAVAERPAPESVSAGDGRITIDDFMKVDLRVARVLAAERVPNSRKLVRLDVDLGRERRTVVAGIADAYPDPSVLVGRSVAVVANLKPATLMGIESNGMVLAASPDDGRPILVTFDEPPPPGTRVR